MAAHDFTHPDPVLTRLIGEPDQCFLCGGSLYRVSVYWSGSDGTNRTVFLHPRCAQNLGCHLISDAAQAKQMKKKMIQPAALRDAAA